MTRNDAAVAVPVLTGMALISTAAFLTDTMLGLVVTGLQLFALAGIIAVGKRIEDTRRANDDTVWSASDGSLPGAPPPSPLKPWTTPDGLPGSTGAHGTGRAS